MTGPTMPAKEQPPRLHNSNPVKKGVKRFLEASKALDSFCDETCGVTFDSLCLNKTMCESFLKTEQEALACITNCKFLKRMFNLQEQMKLIQLYKEERIAFKEQLDAMDEMLKEDCGWPYRNVLYFKQANGQDTSKLKPQNYFLGCHGIKAKQEGSDPNRYIPDVSPDKLHIVGIRFGCTVRHEMELQDSTTMRDVLQQIAPIFCCDPDHTVAGYHNSLIRDQEVNLKQYGVLPGTLFYVEPGWKTVQDYRKAEAKFIRKGKIINDAKPSVSIEDGNDGSDDGEPSKKKAKCCAEKSEEKCQTA